MMSFPTSALPPTLMDLTMLRLSGVLSPKTSSSTLLPFVLGKRPSTFRRIHQAAALTSTNGPKFEPFTEGIPVSNESSGRFRHREKMRGGLALRTSGTDSQGLGLVKELERRVEALDETIQAEESVSHAPYYTEEELMAVYQDVLVVPAPRSELPDKAELEAIRHAEAEEDQRILMSLEDRLCDTLADIQSHTPKLRSTPHRILVRAHGIISRVEATRNLALNTEESINNTPNFLPIGILSIRECQALVRASLKAKDGRVAELALEIMKRTGLPLPEAAVTDILKLYASSGNLIAADDLLTKFLTKTPTDEQRHLHVQAHINGTSLDTLPTSALKLLHRYEGQNAPAPMQTYTSVITSLFSRPSSLARAQGWDIFAHMRYVAHPKPDVLLYTLMIRACASPVNTRYSSEPEKALDLWMEMTQDQKIVPTVGSYNAIILACARSGTKTYVNEALRLARQMLDSHRDAHGFPAFRPDRKTFCALLEGAKRIGDLGRARWILAEMVRGRGVNTKEEADMGKDAHVEIDEEVMMHMFHAYAAYRPPFQRAATKLLEDKPALQWQQQQRGSQPTNASMAIEADDPPSFAHIPPQSRSEVIREVKILFQRVVEDCNSTDSTATATPSLPFSDRKFKNVDITTRLIASYLSVFYKHASLETSRELFWKVFEEHGVVRSLRVYVEGLERCANARKGAERVIALKFADELWIKWRETEQALKTHNAKPSDPRLVERAHVAMVRVLAVSDETDRAMDHLKAFAAQYPPNDVRTPTPKTILRSTRTSLVGSRPLVRMTSETDVPDDHVPPLLMFRDIEVLHHRLMDEGRTKDIGYVTWLCKAYEWALRVRRDAAVKAKVPEVEEKQVTV